MYTYMYRYMNTVGEKEVLLQEIWSGLKVYRCSFA